MKRILFAFVLALFAFPLFAQEQTKTYQIKASPEKHALIEAMLQQLNLQEEPMPQAAEVRIVSAKLSSYTVHPDGSISIVFSDGSGNDFASANGLKGWIESVIEADVDFAKKLLIAWWSARDADLSNPNSAIGKTLTFDISAASPIKVQ